MTSPNPKRQKAGWETIDSLEKDAENCAVIHYSCESFYDRPNGASPRITSIAVRNLQSGQTISFSIHQSAEREGVAFDQIEASYDDLERKMLDAFYGYVGNHQGLKYLHWNMRDANYGFAAIDHRYAVLGGAPVVVPDNKKFDLARILIDLFGPGYTGHPRLQTLLAQNNINPLNFFSGAEEAAAFENKNFVGLHQSTLSKVDVISNLFQRTFDRQLKTQTTWWQMKGGTARAVVAWVAENKVIALLIALVSLAVGVYALE
ncbi:hypothetical protein [Tardiphaga sp.]|uniref:hypothetical protein n=1 Tax=Tardiphaga sp. TaxID=1926292 RepID=UPI0037DA25D8